MDIRGHLYGITKKSRVVLAYNKVMYHVKYQGRLPISNAIAKTCRLRWYFFDKVQNGLIIPVLVMPSSGLIVYQKHSKVAGSKTLNWFVNFLCCSYAQNSLRTRSICTYEKEFTSHVLIKTSYIGSSSSVHLPIPRCLFKAQVCTIRYILK